MRAIWDKLPDSSQPRLRVVGNGKRNEFSLSTTPLGSGRVARSPRTGLVSLISGLCKRDNSPRSTHRLLKVKEGSASDPGARRTVPDQIRGGDPTSLGILYLHTEPGQQSDCPSNLCATHAPADWNGKREVACVAVNPSQSCAKIQPQKNRKKQCSAHQLLITVEMIKYILKIKFNRRRGAGAVRLKSKFVLLL